MRAVTEHIAAIVRFESVLCRCEESRGRDVLPREVAAASWGSSARPHAEVDPP